MTQDIMVPKIGVASLSSPLEVGAEKAPEVFERITKVLRKAGCSVVPFGSIEDSDAAVSAGITAAQNRVDAVVFAPVCWYEDYLVLDFIEECSVPVLLWPSPGMETGALCGAQQQVSYLKKLQHPCHTVFGEPGNPSCLKGAMKFLRAAALRNRLRRGRIGFGGHRVHGMTDTAVDEHMLKKALGPRIVPLDITDILARAEKVPEEKTLDKWTNVSKKAGKNRVDTAEGQDSMAVFFALEELVGQYGLNAVTIGCYPDLMGRVCLAASLLADKGIPMACEGDVNGAAAMLILSLLTGGPTHSTDWLEPLEDGTVVFTHCGSGSLELAEKKEDITLAPVRLMNRGVCALFPAKPGPVTLLSLDSIPGGYRCAMLTGNAVKTEMVFPGNPVRVKLQKPVDRIIMWIFDQGVGHHWMIGHGDISEEIRHWANISGKSLKLIEPN